MRTEDWKQPLGEEHLLEMLGVSSPYMVKAGYEDGVTYYYNVNTWKEKPSYELIILYGEMEIYVCVYALDDRFNAEVKSAERDRVKNLLASYAIACIANVGLVHLIHMAESSEMPTVYIVEEKDDKDFLPLQ